MTTTYTNTSRNSENIVACLVSGEGLLQACISSLICSIYRLLHIGLCLHVDSYVAHPTAFLSFVFCFSLRLCRQYGHSGNGAV